MKILPFDSPIFYCLAIKILPFDSPIFYCLAIKILIYLSQPELQKLVYWFADYRRNAKERGPQGSPLPHGHCRHLSVLRSGRWGRLRFESCARTYIFRRHIQRKVLFSLPHSSVSQHFYPSASSALRLFPIFSLFLPAPFPSTFVPFSIFPFLFSHFYIFFILIFFLIVYFVSHSTASVV